MDNIEYFEASNPATVGVYSRPEILTTSIVRVSIDGQDTDNQLPGFGCGNSPDVYPHSRSRENKHLEDNRQESMDNIECFEASNPATVGVYSCPEILTTSIVGVSIDGQDTDNQLPGFGCGNSPNVYPHSRSRENKHSEDNHQESIGNTQCFEASNPVTVGVYSCPEVLTTSSVGVSMDGHNTDNQLPGFDNSHNVRHSMDCIHDGSFKRKDVLIDKISADKEEMTSQQKDQKNWGNEMTVTVDIPTSATNGESIPISALFLVDTGAECSFISTYYFMTALKEYYPLQSTLVKLKAVNNSSVRVEGSVDLNIVIGKKQVRHTFIVADISDTAILGMDFLRQYKCTWNWESNSLIIVRGIYQ